MSMRWRIFLSFMLVIFVAVGSLAYFAYRSTSSEVSSFVTSGGLWGVEKNVEALEEYYQDHQSWEGAEALLASNQTGKGMMQHGMMKDSEGMHNTAFRLIDANGYVVIDQEYPENVGTYLGTDLQGAVLLTLDDTTIGYLLPETGYMFPTVDVNEALLDLLLPSSIRAAAITGLVGLGMAIILGYFLYKPIRELERAATRLAKGDLTQRVSETGPAETATLGKAFNSMAGELEKADQNRRSMTADIAHELRTPLAVQQANLEAMLDGVYPLDKKNIQVLLDQNHTLRLLVEDLRLLSLVDAGELSLLQKPIELVGYLHTFLEKFRTRLQAKQLTLHTDLPDAAIEMTTDALRLEQILTNLMQNAVTHSPEKGELFFKLAHSADSLIITLRDTGSGIPPELLPVLFERFSKGGSQKRDKESTGLGLAISKKLAQALGGDLTARNHPAGGAEFTLTFDLKK
jgi:signal transduction histidine kinase